MIVYGVDIGVTGAVSCLVNGELRDVTDLPTELVADDRKRIDDRGLSALLRAWRAAYGPDAELALLEQPFVQAINHRGSVLSLGDSFGVCRGVLGALGIGWVAVRPRDWKKAMLLTDDKNGAREMAVQMFPLHADAFKRAKDHNRAESALLAAYGWREHA